VPQGNLRRMDDRLIAYSDESGRPVRRKAASGSERIRPFIPTNPATPLG